VNQPTLANPPVDTLITRYIACKGTGTLKSIGSYKGNVRFQYTVTHDSLYIIFQDYLGRRSIFIRIIPKAITSWNLIEQKPVPLRQFADENPFIGLLEPNQLIHIFWGVIPDLSALKSQNNIPKNLNFSFKTGETEVGRLIQSAVISTADVKVTLSFQSRELGKLNQTLAHKIPGTIPWDK